MTILHNRRQCGPVHPGVHLAAEVGEEGVLPWGWTVADPTIPVNLADLGVSPQGLYLKERVVGWDMQTGKPQYLIDPMTGTVVHDIYDLIGATHYRNAWDFVMEYSVAGLHRFSPPNTMLEKITPLTEYKAIHMKAHLANAGELYNSRKEHPEFEPCYSLDEVVQEMHNSPVGDWLEFSADTCASILYNCLEAARGELEKSTRVVTRELELMMYQGFAPPKDFVPDWEPAIFLEYPFGKLGYFNIIDDGSDEVKRKNDNALEKIDQALMPYRIIEMEAFDGEPVTN